MVYPAIQFGFDGKNEYIARRDALFTIIKSNPKAMFVTRALQFGSEPLFDGMLSPAKLVSEVQKTKTELASFHIPVTVSDFAYSFKTVCYLCHKWEVVH